MTIGSAVLAGLVYDPKGQGYQQATRAGNPIYAGDAYGLDTWKLRVLSHWTFLAAQGSEEEDIQRQDRYRAQYASKVLEGLTDDALRIAEEEHGRDSYVTCKTMRNIVFVRPTAADGGEGGAAPKDNGWTTTKK